jgi:hypothetical protein
VRGANLGATQSSESGGEGPGWWVSWDRSSCCFLVVFFSDSTSDNIFCYCFFFFGSCLPRRKEIDPEMVLIDNQYPTQTV